VGLNVQAKAWTYPRGKDNGKSNGKINGKSNGNGKSKSNGKCDGKSDGKSNRDGELGLSGCFLLGVQEAAVSV